jgi:hypothetical protein
MPRLNLRRLAVIPLFLLALTILVSALAFGLVRSGWQIPLWNPSPAGLHSSLMVSGFLGLIITLERAVALPQKWVIAAPFASVLGTLLLVSGLPPTAAFSLYTASAGILAVAHISIYRRSPGFHAPMMAAGALCWAFSGIFLVLGHSAPRASLLFAAFLILTIAGERLELSRIFLPRRPLRASLAVFAAILALGAAFSPFLEIAPRFFGLGALASALWLLAYDPAPRSWKLPDLPKYIAVCLTLGYIWLGVGGALFLSGFAPVPGPRFDAAIHSILVGFVFSMIMGHFPVIAPALLGLPLRFTPAFYAPVALLHLSVLARSITGPLLLYLIHRWSILASAVSILLFLITALLRGVGCMRRTGTSAKF